MMANTYTNVRREQFLARQQKVERERERDVQRRILTTTTQVVKTIREVEDEQRARALEQARRRPMGVPHASAA